MYDWQTSIIYFKYKYIKPAVFFCFACNKENELKISTLKEDRKCTAYSLEAK